MFWKYIVIAAASYLLGSLNFGVIVSQIALNQDLRTLGSGNAGTTNALRVMGPKLASLVFVGDILKGFAAAFIGRWMGQEGELIAFFFVILGHVYPLYFGFRGGKGILTMAAVLLVFDWRICLISTFIFAVIVSLSRLVSLGSITAALLMPINMYIFHPDPWWFTFIAVILSLGVVWLHRKNIRRLIDGTESRLSFKKKPKA
ncbi:MAG: glycerol-3-phosphate 1-O-acyltransferase PlsY [Clostridiales bacterium]|jgi:glycerol-3-phosphate acyltransferase PlsY|nr:glycerol-3-phosphate 1-O-acyltransferase PlsY [Clostridiales bacterium]